MSDSIMSFRVEGSLRQSFLLGLLFFAFYGMLRSIPLSVRYIDLTRSRVSFQERISLKEYSAPPIGKGELTHPNLAPSPHNLRIHAYHHGKLPYASLDHEVSPSLIIGFVNSQIPF